MSSEVRTLHSGRLNPPLEMTREEWEDWEDEDDEPLTSMNARDGPLLSPDTYSEARGPSQRGTTSASRLSIERGIRPRPTSRQRQKAQNAKAGITLVTDMSQFKSKKPPHVASQAKNVSDNRLTRTGKFVDAAALNALEGGAAQEPGGGFSGWLKKKAAQGAKAKSPDRLEVPAQPQEEISPVVGPIMIGFAMPSDSDVIISPQTAVVSSPVEFPAFYGMQAPAVPTTLPTSVWSPDSDGGRAGRAGNANTAARGEVPAVPSVPKEYRNTQASTIILSDDEDDQPPQKMRRSKRDTRATTIIYSDDEDDNSTPVTLFEEDGSSPNAQRKSIKFKGRQRSGTNTSTGSRGWWDQVTTPFTRSPASPQAQETKESDEWWRDADRKNPASPRNKVSSPVKFTAPAPKATSPVVKITPPEPTPQTAFEKETFLERKTDTSKRSRSLAQTKRSRSPPQTKRPPRIVVDTASSSPASSPESTVMPPPARTRAARNARVEDEDQKLPVELPPPYSPPSNNKKQPVRYKAFFPPGHPSNRMYPPSPGPVSPGLSRTMTSQGAIGLRNVPLTPATADAEAPRQVWLPDRPLGSFLPSENLPSAEGRGPRQKVERQRRRYEKEDAVAFRAGNAWRGRVCFSTTSCFGRPGREGRKRRRICLCIIAIILILIILAIVLPLTVLRRGSDGAGPTSPFLNLTDFPPMPTGISAVVGTDSETTSNCVSPPTMWSCSLPKEQAAQAAPYDASQPTFILQIQFDNNTRKPWNIPNGVPPVATPSTPQRVQARGGTVGVVPFLQRLAGRQNVDTATGFQPNPAPPSFQEMFFLGERTDGVVSRDKAGEPTPFYISILRSLDAPVGPNILSRQVRNPSAGPALNVTIGGETRAVADLLPPPALDADGTGAPAVLLPFPTQQPLRLYDRGLPTERYSFYTYFNKTTYLKSILPLDQNSAGAPVPADVDGGSLKTGANFVVTWLSTRYKVEIWTRRSDTTRFLFDGTKPASNTTRPGTFPYPITITLDTHGGQPLGKMAFTRAVDERGQIVVNDFKLVNNNMNTTNDLVNPQRTFNPVFGGMDGGTGGCKCEYTNFIGLNGQTRGL